ncbi:DNA-3-methyladenine glycosylase I [Oryzibacter oryziterrae]|uniref:DNA-3-methyladenine glycosylase I n=1 Tax=Oryzibacter oryziterrae TaxID=2766474 RepID=UPI001F3894E3|nr:DNA-3-methyladenine glycosylase I [Oryzibacter oryziterrae]
MDGVNTWDDGTARCWWAGPDQIYLDYHDREWGRPVADDQRLFEKLCLEGFQSGLSWITILKKRENFRAAFANFDIETVAGFGEAEIERLVQDAGIVRHRGKIASVINNAKRARELRDREGSLAAFIWRYEPDPASRPAFLDKATLCSMGKSAESTALSKELRKRGWSFVGPTTVYAFMQSMGLVNDHVEGCAFRAVCEAERAAFVRPR